MNPSVLLSIATLNPESGGPARSLTQLASALAAQGLNVSLSALDYGQRYAPSVRPTNPAVKLHLHPVRSRLTQLMRWSSDHGRCLRSFAAVDGGVLHDNGVWLGNNLQAGCVARSGRCRFVVSPRGMLTPWTLKHGGRWKKMLAWHAFQRRVLESAHLLHATSVQEADDLRALGLRAPIAVVANGVELAAEQCSTQRNWSQRERTALFLSRIHPKKGLDLLLRSWAELRPAHWRLRIVGPGEPAHVQPLQALAVQLQIADRVDWVGAVDGDQRFAEYAAAHLFVLPTHSENFGLVIAEALSAGLPVLTTNAAPWPWLQPRAAGWTIPVDQAALVATLRLALSLDEVELAAMGKRGADEVRRHYAWSQIAHQMARLYGWLLGSEARPDYVYA